MTGPVKIVAVGDGAIGKTSMLISYSMGSFPTEYVPTVFDNYETKKKFVEGEVVLSLWDTAGQEEYDHLRAISYPETSVFLLCFSLTNERSLKHLKTKWQPEIEHHCRDVPFIVIGTKSDLEEERISETFEELEEFSKKLGAVKYLECSSKKGINVDKVFEAAVTAALQNQNHTPQHSSNRSLVNDNSPPEGGCCIVQ